MGVGNLVERHDRVHPGGQRARRGAGEQIAQSRAIGVRHHDVHGDAALGGRHVTRPDADECPAVADQGEAPLLQHRTIGDRVPARLRMRGEVGADAADELLVLGPGQTGHLPAAVLCERGDITPLPPRPRRSPNELTDLGLSLHVVMRGIKVWAEAHMDGVLGNRERYDRTA